MSTENSPHHYEASLSLPETCRAAHCLISFTLANRGDRGATFTEVRGIPYCELILKDANGRRPVLQDGDHPFWPLFITPSSQDKSLIGNFEIAPGEQRSWSLDLALYFKLSPGPWTLKFQVRADVTPPERYEGDWYRESSFHLDYLWFGVTDYPLNIEA